MTSKTKLTLLVLLVIAASSFITLSIFKKEVEPYKPGVLAEYDLAVNQARAVFQEKKDLGYDLTSGPCLTNDLLPDWVADLVHSPREKIDDLTQNQCQAFLEGRAKHFVELDLNGNLVRVR